MSKSWRYAWLLIGVVGLMLLVNWPATTRVQGSGTGQASEDTQTLADQLAYQGELQKPWLDALWQPDPAAVSQILADGLDSGQELDELRNTPLHLLFIGLGCRREQRPTASNTLVALQLLLAAGAELNASDSSGNTPLMLAVAHCDAQVISLLISAGADPNRTNKRGLTAFEMTLSSPGDAAYALLDAGFSLRPQELQRYAEIYADETRVIALLAAAGLQQPADG